MSNQVKEPNQEKAKPEITIKKPRYKNTVHLWEFLLELLSDDRYSSLICWSRKDYGEFKLKNQEEVAKRWGILKHRAGMNYEKLSRAIRYYYQQGIIQKVPGQRLVYKFGKLPYEFKPRINRLQMEKEIPQQATTKGHLQDIKAESQTFLPLTSLTPPPELSYPYPLMPNFVLPPVCGCCYDYGFNKSTTRTLHGSPVIFPRNCGFACNMFSRPMLSPVCSNEPLRSIPVPVITSTHS